MRLAGQLLGSVQVVLKDVLRDGLHPVLGAGQLRERGPTRLAALQLGPLDLLLPGGLGQGRVDVGVGEVQPGLPRRVEDGDGRAVVLGLPDVVGVDVAAEDLDRLGVL